MKFLFSVFCLAAVTNAIPALQTRTLADNTTSMAATNTTLPTSVCNGNTADDRARWCEHSIDTDWYNEVPNTGVIREVCASHGDFRLFLTIYDSIGSTSPI